LTHSRSSAEITNSKNRSMVWVWCKWSWYL